MKRLMIYIGLHNEEVSTATTHIIQNIIKSVTNVDDVRKERKKHESERVKNPAARIRAWPFLSEKIGECPFQGSHIDWETGRLFRIGMKNAASLKSMVFI